MFLKEKRLIGMRGMQQQLLLLFLVCCLSIVGILGYACKSPSGRDVEWFVAYKLPDLSNRDPKIASGLAFLYADSRSNNWQLSNATVADKSSAIGQTVSQVYQAKRDKSKFLVLYNDENPNTGKTDSNRAHAKGLVVSDDINGFWLVHSVPKFPSTAAGSGYDYPQSGKRNGQSFLCITFSSDVLTEIGKQLFVAQPNVYDAQMPPSFSRHFPDLDNVVNKKTYPKSKPSAAVLPIRSIGGQTSFVSFSKHKRFDKDLYEELVAPQLRTSLFVETWLVGRGDLESDCSSDFKVHNVQSMRFPQSSEVAFKSTSDHSKWAVSDRDNWLCIGDINRQQSQARRGGGTVCMQNDRIAAIYRAAIADVECCRGEGQCRPR